jgi:hypothetical protein
MLRQNVVRDLIDNPSGNPMTVAEAASLLETSAARVGEMVRLGALAGRVEDGRVTSVSRAALRRRLGLDERTKDRAVVR